MQLIERGQIVAATVDFVFCTGFVAFRNTSLGSWFVRFFVYVCSSEAHKTDLASMTIKVLTVPFMSTVSGLRLSGTSFAAHLLVTVCILPARFAVNGKCRYYIYSEAENHHFRPAGATCCTDSREIWQD